MTPEQSQPDTQYQVGPITPERLAQIERIFCGLVGAYRKLLATVEARPIVGKTADGVEVRVGDAMWHSGRPERKWHATLDGNAQCIGGYSAFLSEFYSTPEAARLAAAEGK